MIARVEISSADDADTYTLLLKKNGSEVDEVWPIPGEGTNRRSMHIYDIVDMSWSDYLELFINSGSDTNFSLQTGTTHSMIAICKLA